MKPKSKPPEIEIDPRFPSGKWIGFWLQQHFTGRQYMDLQLTFVNGTVSGGGADRVGDFTINGTYDLASGNCSLTKSYDHAHRVAYEGRNEGDGLWIWGLWNIPNYDRGGFHLWPEGQDDPTCRKLRKANHVPAEEKRVRLEPVEISSL